MDVSNSNITANTRKVSCECESSVDYRPVAFLGDSVCKVAVREIVKKYEPDKEIGTMTQGGSSGYGTSVGPLFMMSYNGPFASTLSHASKKHNQRSEYEINEEQQHLTSSQLFKETSELKTSRSQNDFGRELRDASYKSKTTIAKISQGIRITTDIFFDSNSKIPENWVVKRVETDIPSSRIINEFQKNAGQKN